MHPHAKSKVEIINQNDEYRKAALDPCVVSPIPKVTWWRHQNGSNFRGTGPLCGEFTGPRWIPLKKASDAELWCFLWYVPE